MVDRYTKCVLTMIAICLAIIAFRQSQPIGNAEAQNAPDGQGTGADEDYPLRASMEAYDEVLKEIRERKL